MVAASDTRQSRLGATLLEGERVRPVDLFFDLVFVLAITQCTALMSHHPTWSGLAQGLLVLGMLWWAWTGYAWLTSVVDPEEGAVRLVMFGAIAALLLVSLCVPDAFGSLALAFALTYGVVRSAHTALFMLATPEDDGLRHSVLGPAASSAVAAMLLLAASLFDGLAQGALWALALLLDMGGPYFFGSEAWKLMPVPMSYLRGRVSLPSGPPRTVQIPAEPPVNPPAPAAGDRSADLGAGGDRGPGAGSARGRQRPDLGDDRLRDPQLRRGTPPGPPPRGAERRSLTADGPSAEIPRVRRRSRGPARSSGPRRARTSRPWPHPSARSRSPLRPPS